MMRLSTALLVVFPLILLSGCSRVRVTTEIKADGSCTRTVAFTGQEKKEGAMQVAGALEDTFVLPTGPQWKSKETKKESDRTMTYERKLVPGTPLHGDVSLKDGSEGGKLQLVNSVIVTRSGKRFEYSETLQWKGEPSKGFDLKPENLAEIKALLPKSLATDENAHALAEKAVPLMIPVLFGPGDPLLAIGLMHPDLAERRVSQRMGAVLLKALEEQFGDQITPLQRRAIAQKLITTSISSSKPSQPDPAAGPTGQKDSGGLTPMMFILKFPGHVISSNGEVDELTGEVYWALFSEAAMVKDLVLTAVVELDPKTVDVPLRRLK
jgi:hypothetical protein